MTRAQLIKSFELWDEREHRFYRNWREYVNKKSKSPRRAFWYGRYKQAQKMRRRRRRQILKASVTGVSSRGLALIKRFEGFRSRPYRDAVGVWTIGYGETRGVGPNTRPVSEKEASQQLKRRVDRDYFPSVKALPTFRKLKQNQVDALVSFVYNVGPGGISSNTGVGRALRSGQFKLAADKLLDWDRAGGRALPGLTRRRREERQLFLR